MLSELYRQLDAIQREECKNTKTTNNSTRTGGMMNFTKNRQCGMTSETGSAKKMKTTEKSDTFIGGFTIGDYNKWAEEFKSNSTSNPLDTQCGGDHYKKNRIQPIEYILANKLGYVEGNIIKYATRWRDKGGIEDLNKIKHYCDFLIKNEQEKGY